MHFFVMMVAAAAMTAAPERSVTGTWSLETEVMGYTGSAVCTLAQEGNSITDTCTSDGIDRPVTGEASGGKFTFQHASEYEGQALTGTCKSYDAAGDIDGTVDGSKVKWLLKRDTGSTGNLNFSGTIGADGTIQGTVDVPSYTVSGAFTATRTPGGQSQPPAY